MKIALEQKWRAKLVDRNRNTSPVLSVCGPSGVGKTTIVNGLAKFWPAFVETTNGNPHLKYLLEGSSDFNASANQGWFLNKIGEHISGADKASPLILDQDPGAIVLAYSRMFLADGKMTKREYGLLLKELLTIEDKLQGWKSPRSILFLDAPADVLHQRVLGRWGQARTPPLKWFDRVRNQFIQLFTCFPNAVMASTANLSTEQVVARAKLLIQDRAEGNPT